MIGAGVMFFFIFSLVIFLFIWEFSRGLMLTLLAWGIGLGITIGLKFLATLFCKSFSHNICYPIGPLLTHFSPIEQAGKDFFEHFTESSQAK
jgi:hypothetical protein